MIDALIAGHLIGKPQVRMSKANKPFVTFRLRAAMKSGDSVFISGISFSQGIAAALGEMDDGDAVAMAGELVLTTYTDKAGQVRPGVDLTAHTLTTEYHIARRKKAARPPSEGTEYVPPASESRPTQPVAAAEQESTGDHAIPF